jgi:motility quorum-sensing regulator/GCU-specific mRNA interferase toxin
VEFSTATKLNATKTALADAFALGLGRSEIVAAIQSANRTDLQKSMTSYCDHRIWQDVYFVRFQEWVLYIKFTTDANGNFLLISFKESDNE